MVTYEPLNLPELEARADVIDCPFVLSVGQGDRGRVSASAAFQRLTLAPLAHSGPLSITGKGKGLSVSIPRAWVESWEVRLRQNEARQELKLRVPEATVDWSTSVSGEPVTIRFFISGLDFFGDPKRPESLRIGKFELELSLLEDVVAIHKRLESEGWSTVTSVLTFRAVTIGQLPEIEELVEPVLWLLSFATGVLLRIARIEVHDSDNAPVRMIARDVPDLSAPWRHPLALDQLSGATKDFLEWSFDRFVKYERKYLLPTIIHMLLLASYEPTINIQALIVANILEIMRFNFALNVLVPATQAREKDGEFYSPHGSLKSAKRMSFADILDELSANLRLTRWKRKGFTEFRNKITHEGEVLGGSFAEKHQKTLEVLHFCHSVVLALLDWDKKGGSYVPVDELPNPVDRSAPNSVTLKLNLIKFVR